MYFTPHLFHLDNTGQKQSLHTPQIWGQDVYILPRSKCSFRRVTLSSRKKNARDAVQLRLKKEAISANSKFRLVLDHSGRKAGAWECQTPPASVHKGRVLPESLAREPLNNGARAVQCLEGIEGQVWQDGNLNASRWWPDVPSQVQWTAFMRAAQVELETQDITRPEISNIPFRSNLPLLEFEQDRLAEIFSPLHLAVVSALVLGGIGAFLSGEYLRNISALQMTLKDKTELSATAEQILSQRRRALGNMAHAQQHHALGHQGALVLMLKDMADVLEENELQIERLRLRDQQLELNLTGDIDISVPDMVSRLEATSSLHNANIALERQQLITIRAQMTPPRVFSPKSTSENGP